MQTLAATLTNEMEKFERPTPVDVEEIFNQFVPTIGGELVSQIISDTSDQPNADYVFKKQNVIAELKCFQKDLFDDNDSDRFEALVQKWTEKGLYTDETLKILFQGQLPIEFQKDMIQAARNSIDNVIRKANRQIRETKKLLNMPNALGLALLCNDGNYFLKNVEYLSLICNVMEHKYMDSDIDGIVYFTVNQVSRSADNDFDHNVWVPAYRNENDDTLSKFVDPMGTTFMDDFYPKITGIPNSHKYMTDNMAEGLKKISEMTYLPKKIAYKKKKKKGSS